MQVYELGWYHDHIVPMLANADMGTFFVLKKKGVSDMTVLKLNGLTKNDLDNYRIKPKYSILVLNLMPTKADTEEQISKLFAQLTEPVAVTFLYPKSHIWKHGDQSELAYHYASLDSIKDQYFDGLIVTGAPVEQLDFTDVDYWDEFLEIRNWSLTHTVSQLFTCWGAQAALNIDFQIPKVNVQQKIFGVYDNQVSVTSLPRNFLMPQSRYSKVETQTVQQVPELSILADNDETGPFFLEARKYHSIYVMGHPEYKANTLVDEYYRDLKKHRSIHKPKNISLTDPTTMYDRWHQSSLNLYHNWLNQIQEEKDNYEQRQLQI